MTQSSCQFNVCPGFTLLEISIVLVIIALIVGGVLVGQDLLESSKFRRLQSDVKQLESQMYVFKNRYNSLPGDLSNAVGVLGSTTENGDGSGDINSWPKAGHTGEACLFGEHLSLAGIIKNSLDCDVRSYRSPSSLSAVQSEFGSHIIPAQSTNGVCPGCTHLQLFFMLQDITSISILGGVGILRADQMQLLDNKFDDGISNSGIWRASRDVGSGNKCKGPANNYRNPSEPDSKSCVLSYLIR